MTKIIHFPGRLRVIHVNIKIASYYDVFIACLQQGGSSPLLFNNNLNLNLVVYKIILNVHAYV